LSPPKTLLTVEPAQQSQRVDVFLQHRLTLSRARIKALFDNDDVRLNERRCKKGDFVAVGDVVEVRSDIESISAAVADASLTLSVLHEDAHLVFVDKPAHMPTHPLEPNETGTLANALLARYPEMASVADDAREAGVCHRLDNDTSGVLVAARSQAAWQFVRAQFKSAADIDKRYVALVTGPLADEGEIDIPLLHAKDHVRPSFDEKARPALTQFKVLMRRGIHSLVEVKIVTGVLHQVRAHLAAVGAPIVGDQRYQGEPAERLMLHAKSLSVIHPDSRERVLVQCEPSGLFSAAVESLQLSSLT
jgi:23S rRNA pseudouridine1911/1915/1917 synthase